MAMKYNSPTSFNSEKSLQVRVNQLFEKNNVQSVRVMQKKTQDDIEQKKQTLRALVGYVFSFFSHVLK